MKIVLNEQHLELVSSCHNYQFFDRRRQLKMFKTPHE